MTPSSIASTHKGEVIVNPHVSLPGALRSRRDVRRLPRRRPRVPPVPRALPAGRARHVEDGARRAAVELAGEG